MSAPECEYRTGQFGLGFLRTAKGIDAVMVEVEATGERRVVARVSYTLAEAADVAALLLKAMNA